VDAQYTEAEIACIKRLAELYEARETQNGIRRQDDPKYSLGVPMDQWRAVLGVMVRDELIATVMHTDAGQYAYFQISPKVVLVARQIREQEAKPPKRNIVEEVKETARGNRVLAWVIIAFIVLAALVAFVNQSLELAKKIKDLTSK
jgi:hypothetical protein